MKAELILTAETNDDEEMLAYWKDCHLQTYVQDFLEIDAEEYGKDIRVSLPTIAYIDQDGRVTHLEKQEPKPFELSMRRLTEVLQGVKDSLRKA